MRRSRSKSIGPDPAVLRSLAERSRHSWSKKCPAPWTSTRTCFLGNPDIVVRPDSVQTARVGLTEMDIETQLNAALYGQVASTIPEQDRMTKIRVRYPDRVRFDKDRLGQLPISLAAAAPGSAGAGRRRTGGRAGRHRLRAARSTGLDRSRAQARTNCGAKPAAGDHRHRRARAGQDLGSVNRDLQERLADLEISVGLSLGIGRQLSCAARIVRQPG